MDYSGSMYNLATAINKHTKHKATVVKYKINQQLQYPTMYRLTLDNIKKIHEMIYEADVVCFFEYAFLPKIYKLNLKKLKQTAVIFSGGGWRNPAFRRNNFNVYGHLKNIKWLTVSTDFKDFGEKRDLLKWVPSNVRTEELREKYDYSKVEPPLITTSPSRSTNQLCSIGKHFREIIGGLEKKGFVRNLHFKSEIIFGVNNHACLTRKARASIFFDRIYSIYGYNSQESGSFESAIVTGSSRFVLDKIETLGVKCPFIIVKTPAEATNKIAELLCDLEYLKRKGKECYDFVRRVHSGKLSAERFIRFLK